MIRKCLFLRHFDKEKSGRLNHQEFKSCLRSLGYDLPMVEEGEPDPEFESILDIVDPNRWETSSVDELNIQCFCHGANINLFCSGMETCPCKSTWPSWSAEKRRTWSQARRSRALSVLSAPRTNLTSPRKNSTRYKISNPCHLQLVLNLWPQFHVWC